MKIVDGVEYLTADEVRGVFDGASKKRFYGNIKPYLRAYHFDAKKTHWYKKSDALALKTGKPVRKAYIVIGGIFKDWTMHLASLGYEASTLLREVEKDVLLPGEAKEFFGISSDKKFVKRSRFTLADGVPICTWDTFYPMELAGDAIDKMQDDMSFDVVAHIAEKHGVVINETEEMTTARLTSMEELNLFHLPVDDIALMVMRVSYTRSGEIVAFSNMVLLANWFVVYKKASVNHWDEKVAS